MQDKVAMFTAARDNARAAGDRGLEAAMTAELERLGVADRGPVMETAIPAAMETAVPAAPRRPQRPKRQPKAS